MSTPVKPVMNICTCTLLGTIKHILEKLAKNMSSINKNALTAEEFGALVSNSSNETYKTAFEILQIITNNESKSEASKAVSSRTFISADLSRNQSLALWQS